jgi:hypothetical protein
LVKGWHIHVYTPPGAIFCLYSNPKKRRHQEGRSSFLPAGGASCMLVFM